MRIETETHMIIPLQHHLIPLPLPPHSQNLPLKLGHPPLIHHPKLLLLLLHLQLLLSLPLPLLLHPLLLLKLPLLLRLQIRQSTSFGFALSDESGLLGFVFEEGALLLFQVGARGGSGGWGSGSGGGRWSAGEVGGVA